MRIGIIGAGIFGLAAALELRQRGHEIIIYERGTIPNERAASTDLSKVIRRTNYASPYLELVERAARQWQTWHDQLSGSIYYPTGKINIVRDFTRDSPLYQTYERLGEGPGGLQILSLPAARRRFPAFDLRPSDTLIFDPWSGYLRSAQALQDLADLARSIGVTIREECPVSTVDDEGSAVAITLAGTTAHCDRVIVAAGAWVGQLFPPFAQNVRVSLQQMAFFKPADPAPFAAERYPVWTVPDVEEHWYGFPISPEGLVKLADDAKGPTADPDVDRDPTPDFLASAQRFAQDRIPALKDAELVGGRACLYTNTPDNDYVIDWISDRVLIAGCGSGHGFKFGGAIGPVVADLLEDKPNPLGDAFRIGDRFADHHTQEPA